MTRKNGKTVTLRSVSNRKKGKNISQEPEMKRLKKLHRDMSEEEKNRTKKHLRDANS